MKDHNLAKPFIDVKAYEGYCRRNYPRFKTVVAAQLILADIHEIVKVTDISHGGCHILSAHQPNTEGNISLSFLKKNSGDSYMLCTPVNGRVVHVHERTKMFSSNIDFRGALFNEHGVQDIIDQHLAKKLNCQTTLQK